MFEAIEFSSNCFQVQDEVCSIKDELIEKLTAPLQTFFYQARGGESMHFCFCGFLSDQRL